MAQGQGSGGSAAAKRLAEAKAEKNDTGDGRLRNRKSKSGLSGMGMNKTAVRQQSQNAYVTSVADDSIGGRGLYEYYNQYNDRFYNPMMKTAMLSVDGFKPGYEARAMKKADDVREKYGMDRIRRYSTWGSD
jgi:hypothetical protein